MFVFQPVVASVLRVGLASQISDPTKSILRGSSKTDLFFQTKRVVSPTYDILCEVIIYNMATFIDLLTTRTQEYIRANDAEILSQASTRHKDLITRIENFRENNMTEYEREEKSVDDLLMDIQTDMMTRAFFRKTTTRQNIGELTQIEWIKKFVPDTTKLKADIGGKYLSDGEMHTVASKIKRPENSTKTFDTYSPSTKTYGILKLTKQAGGAQDNQYNDVKTFIRHIVLYFETNSDSSEKFKFYLDGAYYTPSKRSELNSMIPTKYIDRIMITSCESNAI